METVLIGISTFGIILFIVSFFLRDKVKGIQEEVEQLTLTHVQDMYQIKKKLKILEEELLLDDNHTFHETSIDRIKKEPHEIIKNQVVSLYQQGLSLEQIAKQSSLSISVVEHILQQRGLRGIYNG